MAKKEKTSDIQNYLSETSLDARLVILNERIKNSDFIDPELVHDLLEFDLSAREKSLLVSASGCSNRLSFESYLIAWMQNHDQETAVSALAVWLKRTDRLYWYRITALVAKPITPQRLLFRIIEAAPALGGNCLLKLVERLESLEELAPIVHGLILYRCVTCDYESEKYTKLAKDIVSSLDTLTERPLEKAMPGALCYLARFAPGEFRNDHFQDALLQPWASLVTAVSGWEHHFSEDVFDDLATRHDGTDVGVQRMVKDLNFAVPVWLRNRIPDSLCQLILRSVPAECSREEFAQVCSIFSLEQLTRALDANIGDKAFVHLCQLVLDWGHGGVSALVSRSFTAFAKKAPDVAELMSRVREPLRLALLQSEKGKSLPEWYKLLLKEENAFVAAVEQRKNFDVLSSVNMLQSESDRTAFFDLAFRSGKNADSVTKNSDDFFRLLTNAWLNPHDTLLDDLAAKSRQAPHLWKLAYIKVVGRFANSDKAVLKLLDFSRSSNDTELRAMIDALHAIGHGRAALELISSLTRPNFSLPLKQKIAFALKDFDLNHFQSELRSAVSDLHARSIDGDSVIWELTDSLRTLMTFVPDGGDKKGGVSLASSDEDLDPWLSERFARYDQMSSEVKRALRTARFFHAKVQQSEQTNFIDLSPAIDMQYKALELGFREMFEDKCTTLIERGTIQRKLDVIGYARPIDQKMDQFENYISNLPVINTVPFFSKFKLRKMLRAICQYRPGRRFTLDGVKAFGIFFLVFGRKEDRYGLGDFMSLPFSDDAELFKFVRMLHLFQDTRNRAAHEGFQPDLIKDFDSIWSQTAEIMTTSFLIKDHWDKVGVMAQSAPAAEFRPKKEAFKPPIVVYKKPA